MIYERPSYVLYPSEGDSSGKASKVVMSSHTKEVVRRPSFCTSNSASLTNVKGAQAGKQSSPYFQTSTKSNVSRDKHLASLYRSPNKVCISKFFTRETQSSLPSKLDHTDVKDSQYASHLGDVRTSVAPTVTLNNSQCESYKVNSKL